MKVKLTFFPIIIAGLFGIVSLVGVSDSMGSRVIPPPPEYYVLDEEGALVPAARHAVESLLVEHDHLTGQQIMVAVFKDSGDDKPADWVHQVFQQWRIGKRGRDEGLLFSLFTNTKTPEIEVGYGLESQLPDSEIQKIVRDFIVPDLRKGQVSHALVSGVFHLLEVLNSPLIQSGKATELLSNYGIKDVTRDFSQISSEWLDNSRPWRGWLFLVLLGLLMTLGLILQLLSREAHFTASGWIRPYPWEMFLNKKGRNIPSLGRSPLNSEKNVAISPIIAAIQEAELGTTATIRVHISKSLIEKDPEQKAKKLFARYGMDLLSNPNAVLIYINLKKMRFATVAGVVCDSVLGPSFWRAFHLELERNLRSTQSERAIALSVKSLGETLKKHFPTDP